jgi:uncharacterized membrane protein YbhN (UPF0104 family)
MKRRYWLLAVKALITAGLLTVIFHKVDTARLLSVLGAANPWFGLLAAALLAPNLLAAFAGWRFVLRLAGVRLANTVVFESLLVGYSFGLVTPGGMGEAGRGMYFHNENRLHMVGLSFVQKFYSLVVTVLLGTLGLAWRLADWRVVWLAAGVAAVAACCCAPRRVGKILYRLVPYLPFLREEVRVFIDKLRGFSAKRAATLLGIALVFQLVSFTQFYLLLRAFCPAADFVPVLLTVALVFMLKAVMPVAIADLGVRESLVIFFFTRAPFGLSPEAAFNASFLLFSINVLLPSMLGLFFVHKIKWLRDVAESQDVKPAANDERREKGRII